MLFNDDAVRRIRRTVKAVESSPAGVPKELQPRGFPAPRAFLVGRADETIAATTNPLSSGSINSGTVSIYRWDETDEHWEDTGDDVTAYDFSGAGCSQNDWVQLHRLGHAGGVLWILPPKSNAQYQSFQNNGTQYCDPSSSFTIDLIPLVAAGHADAGNSSFCSESGGDITFTTTGTYLWTMHASLDASGGTDINALSLLPNAWDGSAWDAGLSEGMPECYATLPLVTGGSNAAANVSFAFPVIITSTFNKLRLRLAHMEGPDQTFCSVRSLVTTFIKLS